MSKHHTATLFSFLLLASSTSAQHWLGAMDSNWNNPSNWSAWPLNEEDVTIDPALYAGVQASPVLSGSSAFIPDRLFAQNGAVVSLMANLSVQDRFIISTGATVSMDAGTLSADRLIVEGGGSFTLDAGTVIAYNVLALGDDGSAPSSFTQNGGTVNVTGELGFDVELVPSSPAYRLVQGSLTVNGDVVWFGSAPGGGQGRLLIEGGNAQVNGSVMNTAGSTVDLYIGITGGELMVNGPALDLAHPTDSLMQSAGNLILDNALVLENDGVVRGISGDVLVYGSAELRGTGSMRFHNVTISAGGSLQHTAPDELEVGGDWARSGAFDAVTNAVAFVGTSAQQVSASPFFGMRIANAGPGITLGPGTTTVAGALVLEDGLIHTSDADMLALLDNATATSGSATSHVDGPLRKVGNDDFVFPVGQGGVWRRIGISGINDQDTEFTAEYLNSGYSNTTNLQAGLSSVSTTEHWRLERAVTTEDVRVELFWEDAAASDLPDCALLAVARWNGSDWAGAQSTTTGGCTGNDAGSVRSVDPLSDPAFFTFGTSDGTLDVAELSQAGALLPAPQPAVDGAWVALPAGTTSLALFDLTGQRIALEHPLPNGAARVYVDTGSLAAGLYLVQAWGRGEPLATGRLVVGR